MRFAALSAALLFLTAFNAAASVFDTETFTLDNGMQVAVIENRRAPVVTHMVWYKTGAIDDPAGKSGVAHVLEHMMFKGTPAVPDGEFSKIVAKNGGEENAFTSYDYTAYYQNIARDRLELVMFLESDRMKNLRFSPQDFEPELEVVKEERLMRTENNPAGILDERRRAVLWGEHPYGRPVIGTKKELPALTPDDARRFYREHYTPENAVLVVAGDISAAELKPLAEKYYGAIAPGRTPAVKRLFPVPAPLKSKLEMRHPQAKLYSLRRSYIVPSYLSDGRERAHAYAVLNEILGTYHLGKMYKHFVAGKKTAQSATTAYDGFTLDKGTFSFFLTARDGESLSGLESELDRFADPASVTQKDLEKAKKRLIADLEYLNDDPETAANLVGTFYVLGLSVEDLKNRTANIEAVTLSDVRKAYADMLASASVTTYLMPREAP